MARWNGYSLEAHREAFAGNGELLAFMEMFYFGHTRRNNYDNLNPIYTSSDSKPDKLYSMLPTILEILGECEEKNVLDLGCGTGFFTFPIADRGAFVRGIDNSPVQIMNARERNHPRVTFVEADFFIDVLCQADIIVAPFVINYASELAILRFLLQKLFGTLTPGGRLIMIVDLPTGANLKKFGAVKTIEGSAVDEAKILIDLYHGDDHLCQLNSVYYTPETLSLMLKEIGFRDIKWHKPIISEEGMKELGVDFWEGYLSNPEVGYLSAAR